VLLWQHLFWFFGHPEVYIIFLPALGMVSTSSATFAGAPCSAISAMVLAMIGTGFLAFGLWVHHMFATGLPRLGESFFTASSMTIAMPSGPADLLLDRDPVGRRPVFRTPLLFVIGFIVTFVLGGLTGVMVASVPLDTAGARHLFRRRPFPLCADRRRGVPAARRRLLLVSQGGRPDAERAGGLELLADLRRLQRHLLPHAYAGLWGMPRRVYTYQADMPWAGLNLLSSLGSSC
jgi:cytochrome c oxidase subunit I+III